MVGATFEHEQYKKLKDDLNYALYGQSAHYNQHRFKNWLKKLSAYRSQ